MMHERGKSDSAVGATKPANKAERSAAELVEQRAGTKGNADQQSTRRAQDRESVSQALGRIRKSSPSNTRGKSRMHKGARTDLCGGREVTRVPTATKTRSSSRSAQTRHGLSSRFSLSRSLPSLSSVTRRSAQSRQVFFSANQAPSCRIPTSRRSPAARTLPMGQPPSSMPASASW